MSKKVSLNKAKKPSMKIKIERSALKVFCEKGFEGATIDDICKKAGCSHGLFYHYFTNKKEVFKEMMSLKSDSMNLALNKRIYDEPSYLKKLEIILENMFYSLKHDENHSYFFYLFVSRSFHFKENDNFPPPPIDKDGNIKKPPIEVFTELFQKGQENGEFTTKYSAHDCARLFISIVTGATLGYVIAPKEISKTMNLPNVDFILNIFKKEEN